MTLTRRQRHFLYSTPGGGVAPPPPPPPPQSDASLTAVGILLKDTSGNTFLPKGHWVTGYTPQTQKVDFVTGTPGAGKFTQTDYHDPAAYPAFITPYAFPANCFGTGGELSLLAGMGGNMGILHVAWQMIEPTPPDVKVISSWSSSGTVATVVTSSAHGFSTGDKVMNSETGVAAADTPLGEVTITVTNATTFTYPCGAGASSVTGFTRRHHWNLAGIATLTRRVTDAASQGIRLMAHFATHNYGFHYPLSRQGSGFPWWTAWSDWTLFGSVTVGGAAIPFPLPFDTDPTKDSYIPVTSDPVAAGFNNVGGGQGCTFTSTLGRLYFCNTGGFNQPLRLNGVVPSADVANNPNDPFFVGGDSIPANAHIYFQPDIESIMTMFLLQPNSIGGGGGFDVSGGAYGKPQYLLIDAHKRLTQEWLSITNFVGWATPDELGVPKTNAIPAAYLAAHGLQDVSNATPANAPGAFRDFMERLYDALYAQNPKLIFCYEGAGPWSNVDVGRAPMNPTNDYRVRTVASRVSSPGVAAPQTCFHLHFYPVNGNWSKNSVQHTYLPGTPQLTPPVNAGPDDQTFPLPSDGAGARKVHLALPSGSFANLLQFIPPTGRLRIYTRQGLLQYVTWTGIDNAGSYLTGCTSFFPKKAGQLANINNIFKFLPAPPTDDNPSPGPFVIGKTLRDNLRLNNPNVLSWAADGSGTPISVGDGTDPDIISFSDNVRIINFVDTGTVNTSTVTFDTPMVPVGLDQVYRIFPDVLSLPGPDSLGPGYSSYWSQQPGFIDLRVNPNAVTPDTWDTYLQGHACAPFEAGRRIPPNGNSGSYIEGITGGTDADTTNVDPRDNFRAYVSWVQGTLGIPMFMAANDCWTYAAPAGSSTHYQFLMANPFGADFGSSDTVQLWDALVRRDVDYFITNHVGTIYWQLAPIVGASLISGNGYPGVLAIKAALYANAGGVVTGALKRWKTG